MRRRDFIMLLGGAAAWPLTARAQQAGKLPTIGFLGTATPSTQSSRVAAFVQRLRELGWIENRTVAIEYRWAEGRVDRLPPLAADLVRRQVAVIAATGGNNSALVAMQATSTIPIVFTSSDNPVERGLVASINATPIGSMPAAKWGVLWPHGLDQVRIIQDLPEPPYHLAISLRLIRNHKLDGAQREREKHVAAALQRRLHGGGTDKFP